MDNDGGGFDRDGEWTYNARLPAVIPVTRSPIAAQVLRFVRPPWRLLLVAALASCVGVLTAMLSPYHNKLSAVAPPSPPSTPTRDEASNANAIDSASHAPTTNRLIATASAGIDSEACQATFRAPQLVVSVPPALLPTDQPASLGLTVDGAQEGAELVVCGFTAKSLFSAGHSIDEKAWTVPVSELAYATLIPPQGFVGPMRLAVVLVNTDRSIADRRTLTLQWLPPIPAPAAVASMPARNDISDINKRLEEGKRLKAAGNLALARGIFLRYAQEGDSRAAFLLAETYDPISLAKRQLLPPESDPELARIWYRKSGSQEANARLERLATWTW
jgi:hypothetical protein